MGMEIEAKMKLDDPRALEDRLAKLGAHQGRDVMETNTYFDTDAGSLRATDQALRVRVERQTHGSGLSVTVTHKGPRTPGSPGSPGFPGSAGDLKCRPETQLHTDHAHHAADLASLFEALGYRPVVRFGKRRRYWELDGCEVVIDTLAHLGDFVEIEGPSEQAVLALRDKLALNKLPLIARSYLSLLGEYLASHPDGPRDESWIFPA